MIQICITLENCNLYMLSVCVCVCVCVCERGGGVQIQLLPKLGICSLSDDVQENIAGSLCRWLNICEFLFYSTYVALDEVTDTGKCLLTNYII
jgi:hypothetical protein